MQSTCSFRSVSTVETWQFLRALMSAGTHMRNAYRFITHWRVPGRIEDVYDLIANPAEYCRWWSPVYLDTEVACGDEIGVGRRFRLHTKGFLPYTLRWESCVRDANRPHRLEIRATGDFNGRGIWTLLQRGPLVEADFDWKIDSRKTADSIPIVSVQTTLLGQSPMGNGQGGTRANSRASESSVVKSARRRQLLSSLPIPKIT
jgi:hypothetical protein